MSSAIRKLEREVIRNQCYAKDGNNKGFENAWNEYHYKESVDENGNTKPVEKKAARKKQHHYDDGRVLVKQWKAMKSYIAEMREKAKEKKDKEKKDN